MNKVDLSLRSLLRRYQQAPDGNALRARSPQPPARIAVFVQFTGDVEDLRAAGLEVQRVRTHPRKPFSIANGLIAHDRIAELAAIPHVEQIEGPRTFHGELNHSVPDIGAKTLHEQSPTPFKGTGVVIGIIDSGFDYRHETFCKPDGATRILALWDQQLARTGAEHPPTGYTEGVEYLEPQINAALGTANPYATVRSRDSNLGHGTHVAGIAAGDGSKAGSCRGTFTYIGVAPEADLILVKVNTGDDPAVGNSQHLVNAIEYIFGHPRVAGRPVVINMSMGDYLGGHDGKSLVELDIDIQLLLENGRAIVKSAGNAAGPEGVVTGPRSGNKNKHARTKVPHGGNAVIEVLAFPDDGLDRYIDLWYPAGGRLDLVVEAPGAGAPHSPSIAPGAADPAWVANPAAAAGRRTTVHIDSATEANTTHASRILVHLAPGGGKIPPGTWKLRVANPGAADVDLQLWIQRGENGPEFHPASATAVAIRASDDSTISIPGTAEFVIAVGAYKVGDADGGPPAEFSSRGPTRDGRQKPDIMAPGVGIVSSASNVYEKSCCDCCCDCCHDFYVDMNGTSMAAPHVTGVIALMFQKNPTLGVEQIIHHLTTTARPPGGAIVVPNNDWGHGKVNAVAAVAAVPVPPPPAPLTGPPPVREPQAPRVPQVARAQVARAHEPRAIAAPPRGTTAPEELTARARRRTSREPTSLVRLRERALSTAEGQRYAALVSRHFSEVRGLINAHRLVATSWHLARGPVVVRHLLERMRFPQLALPATLDGPAYRARVRRFFDVVARHASPALRHDLEHHGSVVIAALEEPGRLLDGDGPLAAMAAELASGRAS